MKSYYRVGFGYTHGYRIISMPYPRTTGSGLGATHGHKSISKPYPFGSDIHGYPCPWIKLPSLHLRHCLRQSSRRFNNFDRGLCNKDFCWQVSTLVPNSISEEIAEMNRKLERSEEDLNLANQRFEQSKGKQFERAWYFARKSCYRFVLGGTKDELF